MATRALQWIAVVLICATLANAQEKKPTIGNFPFWSAPKREFADQFVPGLNAALLLSPEQIAKLHEARKETIGSEQLKAKTGKDPNLSDAEREARRKLTEAAHADLRAKVSNILTAEQRALIEQVNAAHQDVVKNVAEQFQERLISSKGNDDLQRSLRQEMQDRIASDFKAKLGVLLSPNQKAACDAAATEELANASKPKSK